MTVCAAGCCSAGVCDEGSGLGQASYLLTLVNLARLGNTHVRQSFDLPRMRRVGLALVPECMPQ